MEEDRFRRYEEVRENKTLSSLDESSSGLSKLFPNNWTRNESAGVSKWQCWYGILHSYPTYNRLFVDTVISSSVDIESELSEAEGYLKAMDIEFRTMSSNEKRSAQQKLSSAQEEYRQMLQRYQSAKFNAEAQALKGGPSARSKLINANQKLDQSTATLEQSRMLVYQTEQIGSTIISDMENQKETLVSAQEKVQETKQFTLDAKVVLRTMGTRAVMHKICIIFTIIILAAVIGLIAYYGFLSGKKIN